MPTNYAIPILLILAAALCGCLIYKHRLERRIKSDYREPNTAMQQFHATQILR